MTVADRKFFKMKGLENTQYIDTSVVPKKTGSRFFVALAMCFGIEELTLNDFERLKQIG